MKHTILFTMLIIFYTVSYAQHSETDAEAKEQMAKLSFLTGDWKGSGWMMGKDGEKRSFTQTEDIEYKLDNTAILVEGKGHANGKVIHNAMAVITWNKEAKNYSFQSYLNTGRGGKFPAEFENGKLTWFPGDTMRYIIYLNDKGQWYETGEILREGKWMQFFEMTLDKDKD